MFCSKITKRITEKTGIASHDNRAAGQVLFLQIQYNSIQYPPDIFKREFIAQDRPPAGRAEFNPCVRH